jgi:hypothetical protein
MSNARPQSVNRQIKRGHLVLAVVGTETKLLPTKQCYSVIDKEGNIIWKVKV